MPSLLTTYLADNDEPCPGCSYNLRGLTTDLCPECRQPLVLRVALREPRIAWFLVGVIALSCGSGFHALGLIYVAFQKVVFDSTPPNVVGVVITMIAALVTAATALTLLLASRRRFGRLSRAARITTAAAAIALTLAGFLAFVLVMS